MLYFAFFTLKFEATNDKQKFINTQDLKGELALCANKEQRLAFVGLVETDHCPGCSGMI